MNGFVRCFEQDVPINPHRKLVADGNLDRRLNVQVPASDLSASFTQFLADRLRRGLARSRIGEYALVRALGNGERRGEHTRQSREAEQTYIVMIDLIAEAGVSDPTRYA